MEDAGLPAAVCWACDKAVDRQDAYCRHCGQGQGARLAWYYRPWGIAVCTLLGLGPFGLILVWRSPRLGSLGRWAWTLAILALTAYIGLGLLRAAAMLMRQAAELQGLVAPY